jgi:hypothetical protein
MTIVCLPSLRPIYRLVVKGSVKSTQHSGYHTASWNGKPNLQTLNTLKKPYSDSTRQLAVIDGDGNRSFTEALDVSNRSTDTTCEMDNTSPTKTHKAGNVIMVKNEIDIELSTRNGAAHV